VQACLASHLLSSSLHEKLSVSTYSCNPELHYALPLRTTAHHSSNSPIHLDHLIHRTTGATRTTTGAAWSTTTNVTEVVPIIHLLLLVFARLLAGALRGLVINLAVALTKVR
jgi:hypothetical protein